MVKTITKEDIEKKQVIDTSDVLRYVPSIDARKYRPGGSGRVTIRGLGQGGRTITLSDGMPLTDLTSRYSNVNWNQIAPGEIEKAEVIYGPFSALYPGNAIGGAVVITTKEPEERMLTVKTGYGFQRYKDYKYEETLPYSNVNLLYGDRLGRFHPLTMFNRLEVDGQPMSFSCKSVDSDTSGVGVPVTGWDKDHDPRSGKPRYIMGDQGKSEGLEYLAKIRLGFDLNEYSTISAEYRHWTREYDRKHPHTYLRDSQGNPVWSGKVEINGLTYSPRYYGCDEREYEGDVYQLSFKRESEEGVKTRVVLGYVDNWKNDSLRSRGTMPEAKHGGKGQLSDSSNGWYNIDWRSSYKPSDSHELTGGFHFDKYFTDSETWKLSDWKDSGTKTEFSKGTDGKTRCYALFLQDDWEITEKFSLYLGGRYEWWKGYDGSISGVDDNGNRVSDNLKTRKKDYFSPKFAVTYKPAEKWSLRLSLAGAYRFPTTEQLYYGTIDPVTGYATRTNPDLKTEKTFAKDFTIKRTMEGGEARISFFENDMEDYILRQTDVYTEVNYYQNIDEVRIRGIEFDISKKLGRYFRPGFNITYLDTEILKNKGYPDSEGKMIPRVPEWAGNAFIEFTPIENLRGLLAAKYSSYPYRKLDNSDKRKKGFGGDEGYFIMDAKISYKFLKNWQLSVAVDNITDELVHRYHPFSARMWSFELKWEY